MYDKFLELFVKETREIKVGDPADHDTFQGPQVNKVQFDKILGYIKAAKEEGGRLLSGGESSSDHDYDRSADDCVLHQVTDTERKATSSSLRYLQMSPWI